MMIEHNVNEIDPIPEILKKRQDTQMELFDLLNKKVDAIFDLVTTLEKRIELLERRAKLGKYSRARNVTGY